MRSALLAVAILAAFTAASCEPAADDGELEAMCARLAALRGDRIETDTRECVETAKREGTTRRQARCRISARNTTEYWVRCRTGEPRE